MSDKVQKALRNLKVGGIYTPIIFGIIFICMEPWYNFLDPSGELSKKSNFFFSNHPSSVTGWMLVFWGINSLLYYRRYINALELDKKVTEE
jgi:hypothetical protein